MGPSSINPSIYPPRADFMARNKTSIINYFLIFSITSILFFWTINSGEPQGSDTYAHIMTGVFFADLFKDIVTLHSFQDLWNYTWNYYAHYSNLGLLHWPPLFHIIEGIYFLLTPINEISARLLIYVFSLLGCFFFYRLMLRLYDPYSSILASVMLITSPIYLTYSRMVSLEIPALSISLIAIYFFHCYLQDQRLRTLLLVSVLTAIALLTKQTSIFLLSFYSIYFIIVSVRLKKVSINIRHAAIFMLIFTGITISYYLPAFYYHKNTILKDVFVGTAYDDPYRSFNNYLFYILTIPYQLSSSTICLLVIYLFLIFFQGKEICTESNKFLMVWVLSCFLTFTLIAQKQERYIIGWVPALSGLAAFSCIRLLRIICDRFIRFNLKSATLITVVILSLVNIIIVMRQTQPTATGYEPIAKYILTKIDRDKSGIIFYDGDNYGAVAFSMRQIDAQRKLMVFRSSKFLYACNIYPAYERWDLITSRDDIIHFFNKYGIRYILIDSYADTEIPSVKTLRQLIKDDANFLLLRTFPIDNNQGGPENIALYAYKGAALIDIDIDLDIPMPTLGKTITIKLRMP
jgi:hypothetical protein